MRALIIWFVLSTILLLAIALWTVPVLWPFAFVVPLAILTWADKDMSELVFYPLYGLRGERAVGAVLHTLDESCRVVHDLDIGRGNVDHVVIGPTGVFAIETKAWTRQVWLLKGPRLMTGRRDESRALRQAERNAIVVREKLNGGLDWVEAVIALSRGRLPRGKMLIKRVHVVEARDLPDFIQRRRQRLDPDTVDRLFAALGGPL